MRRWLLLPVGLLVLAFAAPVAAQDRPRHGGELVFVVPSEPPSYDAHREETFGVIHPYRHWHETSARHDAGSRDLPGDRRLERLPDVL